MATTAPSKRHLGISSSTLISTSDVTIGGNLIVNGTTTTFNTATLQVEDKNIELNKSGSAASSNLGGITVLRGTSSSAQILWDQTNTQWQVGYGLFVDGNISTKSHGNSGNWATAYGWGDHASGGYAASGHNHDTTYFKLSGGSITGGLTIANPASDKKIAFRRTNGKSISIEHDVNQIYFYNETDSKVLFKISNAGVTTTGDGFTSTKGNSAYGWGDHADAGYVTSSGVTTETNSFLGDGGDASTHPGTGRLINTGQVSKGTGVLGMPAVDNSNAFLNINRHSGEYNSQLGFSSNSHMYYRSFSNTAINSSQKWHKVYTENVFANNSENWNTAHGWGNHASAGYLTSLPSHNHDSSYIKISEPNESFNPFGGQKLHDGVLTNRIAGKWDRFEVTIDGTVEAGAAKKLSNQNFEEYNQNRLFGTDKGETRVYNINVQSISHGSKQASGITYCAGYFDICFYSSPFPASYSARCKNKDGNYVEVSNFKKVGNKLRGVVPFGNYLTDIEFTLTAKTSGPYVTGNITYGISEFEYYGSRIAYYEGGNVSALGGYMSGVLTTKSGTSNNWNTAYGWGDHAAAGYIKSFDITAQTDAKYLRSNANDSFSGDLVSTARNKGVFGTYDSYKTDQVWSMGTSFRNHASGTDFGNLYGMAYKHTNNATGGSMAGGHQILFVNNGTAGSAIGLNGNIWTSGVVTAKGGNSGNWNTAHGWGNHADPGYLTSSSTQSKYLRSDTSDTFTGDVLAFPTLSLGIANNNSDNSYDTYFRGSSTHFVLGLKSGNTLYLNYGNAAGTMRTYGSWYHGDTQILTNGRVLTNVTNTNWDTAYGWGNHASAGYLDALPSHNHDDRYFTETESDARFADIATEHHIDSAYKDIYVLGDADKFYPVRIQGRGAYAYQRYSVSRRYSWKAPATWYSATHKGGLTLTVEWSGDTAWGGNHKPIRVVEFAESYSNMVGGMVLPVTGGLLIWLRGGDAQYRIHGPRGRIQDVSIDYDTFVAGNKAEYPIRDIDEATKGRADEIYAKWPVRGSNDLYDSNQRVATQTWVEAKGYLASLPSHNHDTLYLGKTAKAADSEKVDGINGASLLRSDAADTFTGTLTMGTQFALVANKHGRGVFGLYNSAKYQHVWGMGTSWKLADDGSNTGNMYGLAYTHTNVGGESKAGLSHQVLFMHAGKAHSAVGTGIWTKGLITTTSYGTSANWKAAYDWGNHASAGYLTALPSHNHIGVHPLINSSTERGPDFDKLMPAQNHTEYKEVHAINEGTNIPTGAYTYGFVKSQYMGSMKYQEYIPHTASRGAGTEDSIYFRSNWGGGTWYGWKYQIDSGNIGNQSVANAGKLDNIDSSQFMRSDANDVGSGSYSFSNSYNEFGNGYASVSNDGSWNARVNIAGSSHARLDVKSVSDGIITSMYAHTGHGAGKIGTMSGHPIQFMTEGQTKGQINTKGVLHMGGDIVGFWDFSDRRLKTNIKPLENNLEKVMSLHPVSYQWKSGERKEKTNIGLIAQEVEEIVPEVVRDQERLEEGSTNTYKTVDYEHLVSVLIGAVKEQQEQINNLKLKMCTCHGK